MEGTRKRLSYCDTQDILIKAFVTPTSVQHLKIYGNDDFFGHGVARGIPKCPASLFTVEDYTGNNFSIHDDEALFWVKKKMAYNRERVVFMKGVLTPDDLLEDDNSLFGGNILDQQSVALGNSNELLMKHFRVMARLWLAGLPAESEASVSYEIVLDYDVRGVPTEFRYVLQFCQEVASKSAKSRIIANLMDSMASDMKDQLDTQSLLRWSAQASKLSIDAPARPGWNWSEGIPLVVKGAFDLGWAIYLFTVKNLPMAIFNFITGCLNVAIGVGKTLCFTMNSLENSLQLLNENEAMFNILTKASPMLKEVLGFVA